MIRYYISTTLEKKSPLSQQIRNHFLNVPAKQNCRILICVWKTESEGEHGDCIIRGSDDKENDETKCIANQVSLERLHAECVIISYFQGSVNQFSSQVVGIFSLAVYFINTTSLNNNSLCLSPQMHSRLDLISPLNTFWQNVDWSW